ncbi:AraC family transcriptional regulator [uncultured Ruthenibacterium sp.]|uniref:AraC family transcriptional regulator n=1 Tax=uncultured Ruthenibacterium sp. TaxID=1905347 RepID=UPI00349EA85A
MKYEALPLKPAFQISSIVSVHYFEYSSNYYFEGEQHDFWEFLYVDKGELDVIADKETHHLCKGQMIFHRPGEFHALKAQGVSPNLVVISFVCNDASMDFFSRRQFSVGDTVRMHLAAILEEAQLAFSTPFDDPLTTRLIRLPDAPFGVDGMIATHLEQLLISLVRQEQARNCEGKPSSLIRTRNQQDFVDHVTAYLHANISQRLTLADVCRENLVGRSYLQKIFREKTGGGVMEYFGELKIRAAQEYIRDGRYNFTEIASMLGYNSIHYFSRHFKKVTGMTPSEYASSVKVLAGKNRIE